MSEVKVNKVTPRSGTTLTIGDSGDTTNVVGTLQNNGAALVGDISSVVAGTNLSGGGTSGAVTINLADASTSAKGASSFSSDNFAASSGAITIKDLGVATAEIQDDAVTLGKMAPGTDGNIISYDASGNPVAVATGNDGQVLTSTGAGSPPAFETLPASGGLVLISNTTISSAGSLDINSLFSSTYKNYKVIGTQLKCATDNTFWVLQFRTSSAVETGGYYWSGVGQRGAGNPVDDGASAGASFTIISNVANDAASTSFDMTLYAPNVANISKNYTCIAGGRRNDDTGQVLITSGFCARDTQFTGIRLLVGAGNLTEGNIAVYGIKDS